MAYRRRGERISKAKRLKAQSKERGKIQRALDQIEIAKRTESRKRASAKEKGSLAGIGIGAIIQFGLNTGLGPLGWALAPAIGGGLGDAAYVTGHGGGRKTDIEKTTDALRLLEEKAMFAETREGAQRGITAGEIAQGEIAEGDLGTGSMEVLGKFVQNYMMAKGLEKVAKT